jgi:hypothetical protein
MTQSLVRGERVTLSKVDAFADGVAIKLPGAESFRLCRELVDGMVLVDNSAISTAIKVGRGGGSGAVLPRAAGRHGAVWIQPSAQPLRWAGAKSWGPIVLQAGGWHCAGGQLRHQHSRHGGQEWRVGWG